MKEDIDILRKTLKGVIHAKRFNYELYRDQEAELYINYNLKPFDHFMHFHSCVEILYVERGTIHVELAGVEHVLTTGQYIAIPSFAIHDCYSENDSVRWVMLVPKYMLGGTAKLLEGKCFDRFIVQDDGTMDKLMRLTYSAWHHIGNFKGKRTAPGDWQLICSLVTSAVCTAITVCGLREQSAPAPLIIDALKYLHLHFREQIRIPDMAHTLLCTQKTLSDEFKLVMGMTISAYINHLRALDVHANLTEDPGMRLTEAAELAGFGSMRSMLRAYRNEFGCTPTENRGE